MQKIEDFQYIVFVGRVTQFCLQIILWYAGSPTGNITNTEPVLEFTGTQIAIISVAGVGWLAVLGMIPLGIVLCYCCKKKKRKYNM